MDFPAWMYHAQHGARIFETKDELAAAGEGWADAPISSADPEPTSDDDPALDRDALKARATELGLTFARNIKADKLAALIAAKEAE